MTLIQSMALMQWREACDKRRRFWLNVGRDRKIDAIEAAASSNAITEASRTLRHMGYLSMSGAYLLDLETVLDEG